MNRSWYATGFRDSIALAVSLIGVLATAHVNAQTDLPGLVRKSVEASEPRELGELLIAARNLAYVGEHARAKGYLTAAMKVPGERPEWVSVHRGLGSAFFIELSRDPELRPLGQQVASRALSAASRSARDPGRVQNLVRRAASTDSESRRVAVRELEILGEPATAALLTQLSVADNPTKAEWWLRSLETLAPRHVGPAQGMLVTGEPLGRIRSAQALELGLSQEIPLPRTLTLLALANLYRGDLDPNEQRALASVVRSDFAGIPGPDAAERLLRDSHAVAMSEAVTLDRQGIFEPSRRLWFWEPDTRRLVEREFAAGVARRVEASRLAEALVRLAPDDERSHEDYLWSVISATKAAADPAVPLAKTSSRVWDIATRAPLPRLFRVLSRSAQARDLPGAVASCEVLAAKGDVAAVGPGSPLLQALRHPAVRVRHAALQTYLKLDPDGRLPIGYELTAELERTIRSTSGRALVVLDPNPRRARQFAGFAREIGLDGFAYSDSRSALKRLRQDSNVEAILIHEDLTVPRWREVVQQMQWDFLSANIPLIVLHRVDDPQGRPEIARIEPSWLEFPEPVGAEQLGVALRQAWSQRTLFDDVSQAERAELARQGREWLARSRSRGTTAAR